MAYGLGFEPLFFIAYIVGRMRGGAHDQLQRERTFAFSMTRISIYMKSKYNEEKLSGRDLDMEIILQS